MISLRSGNCDENKTQNKWRKSTPNHIIDTLIEFIIKQNGIMDFFERGGILMITSPLFTCQDIHLPFMQTIFSQILQDLQNFT